MFRSVLRTINSQELKSVAIIVGCLLMFGCSQHTIDMDVAVLKDPGSSLHNQIIAINHIESSGNQQFVNDLILYNDQQSWESEDAIIAIAILGGKVAQTYFEQKWKQLNVASQTAHEIDISSALANMNYIAAGMYILGDSSHVEYILASMRSDDENIRFCAAKAARYINTKEMRLALIKTLICSPNSLAAARCSAADSLFERHDPDIFRILSLLVDAGDDPHGCFQELLNKRR